LRRRHQVLQDVEDAETLESGARQQVAIVEHRSAAWFDRNRMASRSNDHGDRPPCASP
jgi:hypothetical protein